MGIGSSKQRKGNKQAHPRVSSKSLDFEEDNGQNRTYEDADLPALYKNNSAHIRQLQLWEKKITEAGVLYLTQLKWDSLTRVNLYKDAIGVKGFKYLTLMSMPQLYMLTLGWNNCGSDGVAHLSKGRWKKLKILKLRGIELRGSGIKKLLRGDWPCLSFVTLSAFNLTYDQAIDLVLSVCIMERVSITNQGIQNPSHLKRKINNRLNDIFFQKFKQIWIENGY